jgi:hypothetical protein
MRPALTHLDTANRHTMVDVEDKAGIRYGGRPAIARPPMRDNECDPTYLRPDEVPRVILPVTTAPHQRLRARSSSRAASLNS